MIQYKIVSDKESGENLTIFIKGYHIPLIAHSSHPNYKAIIQTIREGVTDTIDMAILIELFNESEETAAEILSEIYLWQEENDDD